MANESSIFERLFGVMTGDMPIDYARRILTVSFTAAEHQRHVELAEKSQLGILTDAERRELDALLTANDVLTILHAKARSSLKHSPAA